MTLPLSAADVLGEHVVFELSASTGSTATRTFPSWPIRAGSPPSYQASRSDVRLDVPGGPDQQAVRSCDQRFAACRDPDRAVREGAAQGRRRPGAAGSVRRARRDLHDRGRTGEDPHVPDREAEKPGDGRGTPVDRCGQRDGEPVLPLRAGRRVRPVLREVLKLLPVRGEAVLQRPSLGAAPSAAGGDRLHRAGQRVPWCDQPERLQRICDRLSAARIDAFFRRWLARLPHPFTGADRLAGYRYQLSILQAEFSLTQVLDRPHSGRVFFEQLARDNLDLGRPDRASLIFDRRVRLRQPADQPVAMAHPRAHRRRRPIDPHRLQALQDQAVPQAPRKAIRTETTINDTRDFGIGKRLGNLPALREDELPKPTGVYSPPNALAADPLAAARALHQITDPGHRR